MSATPAPPLPSPANPGEDACIFQIRDLVCQFSGIYQPEKRLWLLQDRCARRIQQLGLHSLRDYIELLASGLDGTREIGELLNQVCIGETCFFRSRPQFEAFQQLVLPLVLANKHRLPRKRIRVWSAGCSTGEEPYTLAMLLLEEKAKLLRGCSFEVLANDLNHRSLAAAQEGIYGEYAARKLSPYFLAKYFTREADGRFRIHDAVRSVVRFSRVNLRDDAAMTFLKGVDVIFCRNVLLYFDAASKRRVMQHLRNNLLPDSYLFLGHSESLSGNADGFRLVQFPGSCAYRKNDASGGDL